MRATRHVAAPAADVYQALLDPEAVAAWRVPDNMTSTVHVFEPREGGTFRVSLTYADPAEAGKSEGGTDTYRGHFAELVPDHKVVEVMEFESADPGLGGQMTMTTTLTPTDHGTEVAVDHDGIPDSVARADNEAGMQMALAKLAALVEARG